MNAQKEQRPSSYPERHLIGQEIKRTACHDYGADVTLASASVFRMKHYQGP